MTLLLLLLLAWLGSRLLFSDGCVSPALASFIVKHNEIQRPLSSLESLTVLYNA